MSTIGLLEALYGECDKGFLYLWAFPSKKTYWFKPGQIKNMYAKAAELSDIKNHEDVYFGVGLSRDPKFRGRASSADICGIPAVWIDIDLKGSAHKKQNLPATLEEIREKMPLEPSLWVSSGHGLHCYWAFKEFWYFDDEQEAKRAQALLRGFQRFIMRALGYKLDSTHDLARVLRMPGTVNYKDPENPQNVRVLQDSDVRYNPDDLEQFVLDEPEEEIQPGSARAGGFKRLATDRGVDELLKNCAFIRYCKESAASLGYIDWLCMVSNVVRCRDGEKAVHELSKPYPKYSVEETNKKIIEALKMHGPQTCKYIKTSAFFTGCPAGGCGVKAPCAFALRNRKAEDITPPEQEQKAPPQAENTSVPVLTADDLTDLGNSERFAGMFGDQARYSFATGHWYIWDGRRYKEDDMGAIMHYAVKTVRSFREMTRTSSGELAEKIKKHAMRSENINRLNAMITLSQHQLAVPVSEMDADNYQLNVNNGVIDLRTGRLLPHSRERMITKLAPVDYDPKAGCPAFKKFVSDIFGGDMEIVQFVQRFLGYCLTGDTSEQAMVFAYGAMGSNGKSTLMGVFEKIVGDYHKTADGDTIMQKKNQGVPNDVARLCGARVVKISELRQNGRLDEPLVKKITGQDTLTARYLRQEFFEFTPTFKIIVLTNHKPKIAGNDEALWRRVILLPFNQRFTGERKDKHLPEKLAREMPGILNWCIEGCLLWQRQGLNPPQAVQAATKQFQEESDVLNNWMEDSCITGANMVTPIAQLFASYEAWCKQNAEFVSMTKRNFSKRLQEKGFKPHKRNGTRCILGIGLLDTSYQPKNSQENLGDQPY